PIVSTVEDFVADVTPRAVRAHVLPGRCEEAGRGCVFAVPVAAPLFIAVEIVTALRYYHARGVAHRDVKPQNLLLARDGALKLSDFGLAALAEQRGRDGRLRTACGTLVYALPFDDANIPLMSRRIHRRDYAFPP
ncbi:CBL-interacting protein kinase 4, partial [Ananas comosus]